MPKKLVGILLALLAHVFGFAQITPISVPGRIFKETWLLEGTLNDKPVTFLLDSGAVTTVLPKGLVDEGTKQISIKLGDLTLIATNFVVADSEGLNAIERMVNEGTNKNPRAFVVLGMNVLSAFAIGLDSESKMATLWAAGLVDKTVAKAWVTTNQKIKLDPIELKLTSKFSPCMGLPFTVGKSKGWMIFDTGASRGGLLPDFVDGTKSEVVYTETSHWAAGTFEENIRMTASARVADHDFAWWIFDELPKTAMSDFAHRPDGIFSLNDLRSPRVLMNFREGYVLAQDPQGSPSESWILSKLIGLPLIVENDEIHLGRVPAWASGEIKKLEGNRLSAIAGHTPKEILDLVRSKDQGAADTLKLLVPTLEVHDSIVVESKDGSKAIHLERPSL